MVSYMDNVVDTLASQVLRGKLDELTHFVRHKLNFSLSAYEEYESIESLQKKKGLLAPSEGWPYPHNSLRF